MKLEYHPQAAADLNKAVGFYDSRRAGLGDELRSEVYATIESIRQNARRFRAVDGTALHRCFVRRFPYSVLFRVIEPDRIRILVIRHHRQQSSFGASRR